MSLGETPYARALRRERHIGHKINDKYRCVTRPRDYQCSTSCNHFRRRSGFIATAKLPSTRRYGTAGRLNYQAKTTTVILDINNIAAHIYTINHDHEHHHGCRCKHCGLCISSQATCQANRINDRSRSPTSRKPAFFHSCRSINHLLRAC